MSADQAARAGDGNLPPLPDVDESPEFRKLWNLIPQWAEAHPGSQSCTDLADAIDAHVCSMVSDYATKATEELAAFLRSRDAGIVERDRQLNIFRVWMASAVQMLEAHEAESLLLEQESVGAIEPDDARYFEAACKTNRAAHDFRRALSRNDTSVQAPVTGPAAGDSA